MAWRAVAEGIFIIPMFYYFCTKFDELYGRKRGPG